MKHGGRFKIRCKVDGCQFGTNDHGKMKVHMNKVHKQGEEVKCKRCGKAFTISRSLEVHNYKAKKVITCKDCGKKFKTKNALQKHQQTYYTATPQFVCSICGKTLGSASALKAHEARHPDGEDTTGNSSDSDALVE